MNEAELEDLLSKPRDQTVAALAACPGDIVVLGAGGKRQADVGAAVALSTLAEPGRGFHTGGAFPMRDNPGPLETDRLGRPAGLRRVHAVDATVFPSIAATTITLTAMANAHRIAIQSLEAN